MQNLTLADIQRALSPSSMLSPSEKAEVLRLLAQLEQVAEAETFEDPRCPMADYLLEFGGPPSQSTVRQAVRYDECPDLATFIASFAPVLPPTPTKAEAKVSVVPDVPLVVPTRRQLRLLQEVIEATEAQMRDGHDPLEHYRSKSWLIDAPHPDE